MATTLNEYELRFFNLTGVMNLSLYGVKHYITIMPDVTMKILKTDV